MSTNISAPACAEQPARKMPTPRVVDLDGIPTVGWALLNEHQAAAVTGRAVKSLQTDRQLKRGIPYRKLNGSTVRYRMSDVQKWIEDQPLFCSGATPDAKRGPGRPRKA